jgi:hypothetical protein
MSLQTSTSAAQANAVLRCRPDCSEARRALLVDHLMDMNNAPEPRMPPIENLQFLDLVGVISSLCNTRRPQQALANGRRW